VFCRKPNATEVYKRRLRWAKAFGVAGMEVASRGRHTGHHPKAAASALTCVNVSLEFCKVIF
jgi:hypothetical protein